ncbi:MAG: hypothetical protein JW934_16665 [Anaerolineae bacterium]|nr:hypothetical protein [Anaerolineae bacterium]
MESPFVDLIICPSLIPGCLYWYILGSDGVPLVYGNVNCDMETIRDHAYIILVKEAVADELGVDIEEIKTVGNDLPTASLNNQLLSFASCI